MNLHGIVSGAIGTVNPFISVLWRRSTGNTQALDLSRTPTYTDVPGTLVQLQPLTSKDLQHADALNIQGTLKSIHMNGDAQAIVRGDQTGGDLFVINGKTWLAVHVLETWPDWCRVVIQLQTKP